MGLVFLSHSSRDNDAAVKIKKYLDTISIGSVFLDFDKDTGIGAGEDWEKRLYKEIDRAIAVVLLLTPAWLESKWCFAEFTQARALGKSVFPVIVSPIGERFFASDIQSVDIVKDNEGGLERLRQSLSDLVLASHRGFTWDPNRPLYPGLLAFTEEDAAIYFGRDDDIRSIIWKLNARRVQGGRKLLALLAASGSGKSSLLRAGIIPQLKRDSRSWIVMPPFRPRFNPIDEFARSAAVALGNASDWRKLRDQLTDADSFDALRRLAQDLQTNAGALNAHILLPIDQGEELFTVADESPKAQFFALLKTALDERLPYICLLVMRSEQLGSLQEADTLLPGFDTVSLNPLPLGHIPAIIKGPADLGGLEVEDALITAAISDAQTPDALPLLALTLRELYERSGVSRTLTLASYKGLGDEAAGLSPIENAVRRAADEALAGVDPSAEELESLRLAFIPALVRVDEKGEYVRRPAAWEQLPPPAHRLLEALTEARLLVRDDMVEVAHEALLRKWPTLRQWLDLEREFLIGKVQFDRAMADWDKAEPDMKHDALLRGLQLNRARQWLLDNRPLEDKERQFIELSSREADAEAQRRTRMKRMLLWGASASAAIFALLTALASWKWYDSELNRNIADHNYGLALLTSAEILVAKDQPAHAFLTASKAIGNISREDGAKEHSYLGIDSPEFIRARTLADITSIPARFPKYHYLEYGGAHAVSLSYDGDLIASAGQSLTVSLTRIKDMVVLGKLTGHKDRINNVAFNRTGDAIATASSDGTIALWDLKVYTVATLRGHEGPVIEVNFHPERPLLASASRDGKLIIWDKASKRKVQEFTERAGLAWLQSVKFSDDGTLLAYADNKGWITIRSTADWSVRRQFSIADVGTRDDVDVISVAFSPNSESVAAATFNGSVYIWRLSANGGVTTLSGHRDKLWKIVFTPDGKMLATASWDGSVRFWDSETLEHAGTFDAHDHWVNDISFSTQQPLMATASEDGGVRIWEYQNVLPMFAALTDHQEEALRAVFSADGSIFATGGADGKVFVYTLDERLRPHRHCSYRHADWVRGLAMSHAGNMLASAGTVSGNNDNVIRLLDASDCSPLPTTPQIEIGETQIKSLAFSPNDESLAAAASDGSVRIWDVETGKEKAVLRGHSGPVFDIVFDSSGQYLASAGKDKLVIIWRLSNNTVHRRLLHEGPVWRVKTSPDGMLLASGGGEQKIWLWNWKSGESVAAAVETPTSIADIQFTSDSNALIVGDDNRSISVWDTRTWQRIAELNALVGVRGPLATHPKLPILAFDGEKGVVRFWDLRQQPVRASASTVATFHGTKLSFKDAIDITNRSEPKDLAAHTVEIQACP